MTINKGWLIMELIDTNGNVILYYGTLVLNPKEREYKRLSYENMLKVLTDNCYIINNKLITRFGFDLLSKDKYSDIIYQYFIITKYCLALRYWQNILNGKEVAGSNYEIAKILVNESAEDKDFKHSNKIWNDILESIKQDEAWNDVNAFLNYREKKLVKIL